MSEQQWFNLLSFWGKKKKKKKQMKSLQLGQLSVGGVKICS